MKILEIDYDYYCYPDGINSIEDFKGNNLIGHREKITLDGECWGYEEKK